MTEEERKVLETAVELRIILTEMIERALLAAQRLCAEIQSGNPSAIETAKDVEQRLGNFLQGWNELTNNKRDLSS